MLATEFLEGLQSVYRHYDYLVEIIRRRRRALQDPSVEAPRETADIPTYARELADRAIGKLIPEEQRDAIRAERARAVSGHGATPNWVQKAHAEFLGRVTGGSTVFSGMDLAVGILETASFNASCIPVPDADNAFVLALHHGVSGVTYEVARAVAASFRVGPTDANVGEECLDVSEAARLLHGRLNYFLHLGAPWGEDYQASRDQLHLASSVTTMAERFVYLHEVAHVMLGHVKQAPVHALPDDWSNAKETVHGLDQEHEADVLSWELLTRFFVRSTGDLQMAYAGTSLFLHIAAVLERAEGPTNAASHPSAHERWGMIRQAFSATCGEARVDAKQAATIASALIERFEAILGQAPQLPGPSPLEKLLADCSSGLIPDYMRFQEDILMLLSHSAPAKACRALGHALAEAELELRSLGLFHDSVQVEKEITVELVELARKPLNKLKLISGILGLYLTPEIGNFIERARDERLRGHDA